MVRLSEPANTDAWIYYIKDAPGSAPRIDSGDWLSYEELTRRQAPTIRSVTASDIDLTQVAVAMDGAAEAPGFAGLSTTIAENASTSFVAEYGGNIVGVAAASLATDDSSSALKLAFLWVASGFRSAGLSDRLLDRMAEAARRVRADRIEAANVEANSPVERAFTRLSARLGSTMVVTPSDIESSLRGDRRDMTIPWTGAPASVVPTAHAGDVAAS